MSIQEEGEFRVAKKVVTFKRDAVLAALYEAARKHDASLPPFDETGIRMDLVAEEDGTTTLEIYHSVSREFKNIRRLFSY